MHELCVNLERQKSDVLLGEGQENDLAWTTVGFPRGTGEGPALHCLIKSNKREN